MKLSCPSEGPIIPSAATARASPDKVVFGKLVEILVFGCAYWRIADESCSESTLRRRRDEWIGLGLMERLREISLEAYDRLIGLEMGSSSSDDSSEKAGVATAGKADLLDDHDLLTEALSLGHLDAVLDNAKSLFTEMDVVINMIVDEILTRYV